MFRPIVISILLSLSATFNALSAQDLLGIEGEEATTIGVYIKDIRTSEVLYDYNSDLALTPASVMKAVTAATALSKLGENFRFSTPVELRGSMQAGNVWRGDLVVRSCGDPTIESQHFKSNLGICDSISAALRRLGIKKIDGRLIVEQNMSDAGPVAQWEIEDVPWPYGAGLFGFNYRDNTAILYPLTGETKPFVPALDVSVVESKENNDLVRGVGSDRLTVYARNVKNRKWALEISVPDPAAVFLYRLHAVLKDRGIAVSNKKADAVSSTVRSLYIHRSPAAKDILTSLMFRSDNLFAEGILRALAPDDTRKNAVKCETQLWGDRGLTSRYNLIFDGSGLSRGNRLQPRFLADVLEWMVNSPMADTYVSFFPRAGYDGTMKSFLAKSPLKGLIALKTGSMNAVQSYAGFKLDENGKPTHIIVIMVNGFFCSRAQLRRSIEQLLTDTFI